MKSQYFRFAVLLVSALALVSCAGLQQFPSTSTDYVGDLGKLDPDFLKALEKIEQAAGKPEQQKLLRDMEIERRLRVIDRNFDEFRKGLAKENVAVNFGVAVVEVGVGAAGALVAETASQILSAASGGLAGAQQAYSKAALFDQTLSALLAQMIASRKAVLVTIYERRAQDIDTYSLSAAVQDLNAYEFAGSLPGAVIATSADAKVKKDQADTRIIVIQRKAALANERNRKRVDALLDKIDALSDDDAKALAANPPVVGDEAIDAGLKARDPDGKKLWLTVPAVARDALKFMLSLTSVDDLFDWEEAEALK